MRPENTNSRRSETTQSTDILNDLNNKKSELCLGVTWSDAGKIKLENAAISDEGYLKPPVPSVILGFNYKVSSVDQVNYSNGPN